VIGLYDQRRREQRERRAERDHKAAGRDPVMPRFLQVSQRRFDQLMAKGEKIVARKRKRRA